MNRKLTHDERAICIGICTLTVLGIYLYVKLTMSLFWPFTWIDSLVLKTLSALLYVGLPLVFLLGIFMLLRRQYQRDIKKYCEAVIKEMGSLEWRFTEFERSTRRRTNSLEDDLKALRKEFEKYKETHISRNLPIEAAQDQALKNFL